MNSYGLGIMATNKDSEISIGEDLKYNGLSEYRAIPK
jgi:hypothetical protein